MPNFGCLIYPDGELVECNTFDHGSVILQRLNIINYSNIENFDHEKFCYKHGIVRIVFFNNTLTVAIPNKVTKKQLKLAYNYCLNITNMLSYFLYNSLTNKLYSFNNNEDLLKQLEKEINGATNSI